MGLQGEDLLLGPAWADPARFPEEVRNYVRRIRKILADLERSRASS